jgi:hypothetical protein
MQKTVNVEFNVRLDKSIYQSSPWNTKESFFERLVLNHVDSDYNFFVKEHARMESPKKEEFSGLVQTLKEIKSSIKQSIKYQVVNTVDNIEEVKISFSFNYYATPLCDIDETVNTFIFNKTIKSNSYTAKDITRFPDSSKKNVIEAGVKMYNHVASFMEEAKSSLVIEEGSMVREEILLAA